MAKIYNISLRMDETQRAAMDLAALDRDRSTCGLVRHILTEWLIENGYMEVPVKEKAV